jgi:predicted nucleic acid-binding protein
VTAPRFLVDTSVLVAVLCSWHEQHTTAVGDLERWLAAGATMVVAGPTLIEAYAVLTRLPAPYRLAAADAHTLITANFVHQQEVVTLPAAGYVELLDRLVAADIAGGQAYDAVVAECARQTRVDALITFNPWHFTSVPAQSLTIAVPGIEASCEQEPLRQARPWLAAGSIIVWWFPATERGLLAPAEFCEGTKPC